MEVSFINPTNLANSIRLSLGLTKLVGIPYYADYELVIPYGRRLGKSYLTKMMMEHKFKTT